jgi:beta-glucosidase
VTIAVICLAAGAAATLPVTGLLSSPAVTTTPKAPTVTGDARADALLARMTLADKLRLLEWIPDLAAGPGKAATLPGLPRLGVPALHLADGMPGAASGRPAPAMTAPLGVAATFSQRDAYANGAVIGRDARALGQQVVGLPLAAMTTGAAGSQDAATFGGDPLLAGRTAAAEVRGIQRQGTMAMAEGYLGAGASDASPAGSAGAAGATAAGPAALHEIYLPPFEDAIRAGLAAIMCSPASVQVSGVPPGAGVTATSAAASGSAASGSAASGSRATGAGASSAGVPDCDNPGMLMQILRDELGFGGFVSSDWGANPSTLSLNSGLDLEMGTGNGYFSPAAIRAAVANGSLRLATLDRAVATVLAEMDRFGLLRHGRRPTAGPVPVAAGEQVVRQTSQDAATLLKDDHHALPLATRDLSSLALIGANAGQDVVGGITGPGGWDASGSGPSQASPYQALRRDLAGTPGAHLSYTTGDDLTGTAIPASMLSHDGQPGLLRSVTRAPAQPASGGHGASTLQHAAAGGHPRAGGRGTLESPRDQFTLPSRTVADLDNTAATGAALAAGSAHDWSGELTVPETGTYRIGLALSGAEGSLTLDGATIAHSGPGPALTARQGITGPATDSIIPTTDGLDNLGASVTLTAGTHTLNVAEVPDASGRPVQIRLYWVTPEAEQASRAAAISAARHAHTAVVFAWSTATAGSPLPDGQDDLIKQVSAANPDTIVVLQTPGPVALPWFRGVKAVLELWYPGDPGGSASASVLLGRTDPAGRLPFSWPTKPSSHHRTRQVFPLGYGISYTTFRYSGLTAVAARGGGLTVRFRVTNTGTVAGDEVPQVYLGPPSHRPPGAAHGGRTLAAYTRIALRPGQSRAVTLRVPGRQLQYWDDTRGWLTAPGQRPVSVGPSEGVSALTARVNVPG